MLGREILFVVALLVAACIGDVSKPDLIEQNGTTEPLPSDQDPKPLSQEPGVMETGPSDSKPVSHDDARRSLSELSGKEKLRMLRVVAESVNPVVRLLSFWWRSATELLIEYKDKCEGACDVNAACVTVGSSYRCDCHTGFKGSGLPGECFDVDECLTDPCDRYAHCSNTEGSYSCSCVAFYTGSGEPGGCTWEQIPLRPGPAQLLKADLASVTVTWSPPALPNVQTYIIKVYDAGLKLEWSGSTTDTTITFPLPSKIHYVVEITAVWEKMEESDGIENISRVVFRNPS